MKKNIRRLFAALMALTLMFGVIPFEGLDLFAITARAATSGSCGDGLTYEIDLDAGLLEIIKGNGSGVMNNYDIAVPAPWSAYKESIRSVTVHEGVTVIGRCAFYGLYNLESASLPETITKIDGAAFSSTGLKTIELPAGNYVIEPSTFAYCSNLTSVTIPEGITALEQHAFDGCTSLKTIMLPEGMTTIMNDVFSGSGLESIEMPSTMYELSTSAFADCYNLKSIKLNEGLKKIGNSAFMNCKALEEIIIPSTVTTVGGSTFSGCSKLKYVTLGSEVRSITGSMFYNCTGLESVDIQGDIETVGDKAFFNCSSLKSLDLLGDGTDFHPNAFTSSLPVVIYTSKGDHAETYRQATGKYVREFTENAYIKLTLPQDFGSKIIIENTADNYKKAVAVTPPQTEYKFNVIVGDIDIYNISILDADGNELSSFKSIVPSEGETPLKIERLSPPKASVTPGFVAKGTKVEFSSDANTKIVYTVDGGTPQTSPEHKISIIINKATTISAYTSGDGTGKLDSETVVFTYNVCENHEWNPETCTTPQTCKICGSIGKSATGHNWQDATCAAPRTCSKCNITEGKALEHQWIAATCTKPKTCSECKATTGTAKGHSWTISSCTEAQICSECGEEGQPSLGGHNWSPATCTEARKCTRCPAVEGEPLGHNFAPATCTEAAKCTRCPETTGEALGHNRSGVACTEESKCLECGEIIPASAEHDWTLTTCTTPKTCTVCGMTEGKALGHNWQAATCKTPSTCSRCNATTGSVSKTHSYGDWKVIKAATYDEEGQKERTCSVCGGKDYEEIAKLIKSGEGTIEFTDESTLIINTEKKMIYYTQATTVSALLANFKNENLVITDSKGNALEGEAPVGSGALISLISGDKTLDSYTVIMLGDLNGNGSIQTMDARLALRAAVRIDELNPWQNAAADINRTGSASTAVARKILRCAVGIDPTETLASKYVSE